MPENKDDIDLEGWDLHRAAAEDRIDIARTLIEYGADVDAKDKTHSSRTPLSLAADKNSLEVARLLIENGAEVNARSKNGSSPLHVATLKNSVDAAGLLIDKGANTDGIDLGCMDDREDA